MWPKITKDENTVRITLQWRSQQGKSCNLSVECNQNVEFKRKSVESINKKRRVQNFSFHMKSHYHFW